MAQRGGARKGAGRKPGKLSNVTLEKLAVRRAQERRILAKADLLHNAQYALAVGSVSLFRIDADKAGIRKHRLVTDDAEVADLLDALQDSTQAELSPDSFVFVQYNKPDNRAIDSMLNRVFGKPATVVEIEQFQENNRQIARLFAMFFRALQNQSSPVEQLADAVSGYCSLKGIDLDEMARMVQEEIDAVDGGSDE